MLPYIAEFIGTMLLILLGDGVVANVNLNKSGMKGGGSVQITLAWGLAVLIPAYIFGAASGASFNPGAYDCTGGRWKLCMVDGTGISRGTVRRRLCWSDTGLYPIQRTV